MDKNDGKYFQFSKEKTIGEILPKDSNDIDIINEEVLNNLIINNINKEKHHVNKDDLGIKDYEYFFKENELFIKVNEGENNNYYLVIFKCENDKNIQDLFIFKEKKDYSDKNALEKIFNNLKENNNKDENKNQKNELKGDKEKEVINSKKVNDEKNIKILIMYYIFKNQLKKEIKNPKANQEKNQFYYINKNWMDKKYKEKLEDILNNSNMEIYIINKENIYNEEIINELYKEIKKN